MVKRQVVDGEGVNMFDLEKIYSYNCIVTRTMFYSLLVFLFDELM